MRKRLGFYAGAASLGAFAAAAALLAWVFGMQGSVGLYRWEPYYRTAFQALGAAGLLPLAIVALSAAL
ncbi:MAG: hypothetical protein Q8M76_08420, partial [Spirochaetaceae bacterium]|nr:hypothetical protein [Spirochaetaceae bacterium]